MKKKSLMKGNMREMSMLIALVIIIVLFTILTKGILLRPMNIANLINQNAYVVILACGMLLCILTGGNIDLSVGSTVALVGAFAGTFIITWGWNPYLSIVLCLLIGIGLGAWQGFWIAYVGIPPFICTLSGMLVFRGITLLILNGLTLAPFPAAYTQLSTGFIPDIAPEGITLFGTKLNLLCLLVGVAIAVAYVALQIKNNATRKKKGYETEPLPSLLIKTVIICAAVIAVFWKLAQHKGIPTVLIILGILLLVYNFITQKTVMGRHLYAIGGNKKAAELSGVKTRRIMFLAYLNMAFLAAITTMVLLAREQAPAHGRHELRDGRDFRVRGRRRFRQRRRGLRLRHGDRRHADRRHQPGHEPHGHRRQLAEGRQGRGASGRRGLRRAEQEERQQPVRKEEVIPRAPGRKE